MRPPPRPGSPHWGGYSRDPHPPLSRPAGPRRLAAPRRDFPVAPRVSASPRRGGVGPRNEAARVGRSGRAVGPQEGGGRAHGGWWWAPPSSRHCSPGPGRSRRRIKKKKESPHTPRGSWRRPASARGGGGGREQGGGGGGAAGQFVQARAPLPGGRAPGTAADNDLLPAGAGRGPAAPQPGHTEKATRWAEAVAFVASAFAVATEWRATCRRPWPRLSVVDSRGPYREEFTSWCVENYPQLDGTGTGECSRRWACRAGQPPPAWSAPRGWSGEEVVAARAKARTVCRWRGCGGNVGGGGP